MARTTEMKLHHFVTSDRDRKRIYIAYFYDTHLRLWTAYETDEDDNQLCDAHCEFDKQKIYAIQGALIQHLYNTGTETFTH